MTPLFRTGILVATFLTFPSIAAAEEPPTTEPNATPVPPNGVTPPASGPTTAVPAGPAPSPPTVIVYDRTQAHGSGLFGDSRYRSPGLAAALSLTPVPVDFGNFYAENVGWGLVYTTGQLALAGSMMWLGGTHMCHARSECTGWSDGETGAMVALVSGYVVVKIVAAVHAASAASAFNHRQPSASLGAAAVPGGAAGGFALRF